MSRDIILWFAPLVGLLGCQTLDEEPVVEPSEAECITRCFRRTFTVDDPALYGALVLHLLRDDGAAVYLNGALIMRSNLPAGIDDEDRFYVITGIADRLVTGTNVLAVEVHPRSPSTASFDLAGDALDDLSVLTPIDSLDPAADDDDPICLVSRDLSAATELFAGATVLASNLDTGALDGKTDWDEFTLAWEQDDDNAAAADWMTLGAVGEAELEDLVDALDDGRRIYALPPKAVQTWGRHRRLFSGVALLETDDDSGAELLATDGP